MVVLYEDELTYHRRPRVGSASVPSGSAASRAAQGLGSDTLRRIAGCLAVHTGQCYSQQRAHWTVDALTPCLQGVAAHYPAAERLCVVLDTWPVHFHPALRAPLAT